MDGLRGLLAVYVLLSHALPFTDLPAWLCRPFHHGEAAVDLFFCLSGLVIMNSLDRAGGRFLPFIVARARRLLPVYLIALAASTALLFGNPAAAMPWLGRPEEIFWSSGLPQPFIWHLLAHLLLLQGLVPAGILPFAWVTLLTPAWSLSTEWQFYMLLGLTAPRRIAPLALALIAVGAVYHATTLPPAWQFSRAFLPDAAPYFALGLASARLLRGQGAWLFIVCLVSACVIGWPSGPEKSIVPLAWAGLLLAQNHRAGAVLESRVMRFLGAVSYPLYLLQEPVQRALAMLIAPLAHGRAGEFTALWLPLALAVPILAATALHRGVERRFMQPRDRVYADRTTQSEVQTQ